MMEEICCVLARYSRLYFDILESHYRHGVVSGLSYCAVESAWSCSL